MPAPRRAGTAKRELADAQRMRAEELAREAVRGLADDQEALDLVVRVVRVLAKRSRRRRI